MAKRCPACGQVYSDNTKFCDQDGTTLTDPLATQIPPPAALARPSRKRMVICLAAAAVVLAAAASVAYYLYQRHLQSSITITLTGIALPGSPDSQNSSAAARLLQGVIGAAQAAMGNGDLVALLKIGNGTRFSGEIVSASYTIHAADRQIGAGSWAIEGAAAPVKFQAGQEIALNLPFRPDPRNSVSSVLELAAGRDVPVKIRGTMKVKALFFTFTVPFDAQLVRPGESLIQQTQSF